MNTEKPLVFVSCGQYAPSERALGNDICGLIRTSRPDLHPYFAQDQSTVDGLSQNILGALHQAAGLVCVMHQRGGVFRGSQQVAVRGSVWIEQEIAIVTFMNHVLDRRIPVFFYVQKGVSIEGIRTVLHLNPRAEFTDESEVLDDLRGSLPEMTFNRYAEYDLQPVIDFRTDNPGEDRHDCTLIATVENTGVRPVTDFSMEVYFPIRFLETSTTYAAVDTRKNTKTHFCFVVDQSRLQRKPLYSGQRMIPELTIPYHVDDYLEENALSDKIRVKLYSGSMRPVLREYEMRRFQDF